MLEFLGTFWRSSRSIDGFGRSLKGFSKDVRGNLENIEGQLQYGFGRFFLGLRQGFSWERLKVTLTTCFYGLAEDI